MRDELYIDGRKVDLGKETDIKLNYLVSKVADLSNIMSNYSYTIELPKTENNVQIIEFSDTVNVVTEYPYQEHVAEVRRDGVPLFVDGKAYIDSTGESIKVLIKWGGSELLSRLQKTKMQDAALIDDILSWKYDFENSTLSYATWVPMLDGTTVDMPQTPERFRPAVKVQPFFDGLFSGKYTLSSQYRDFLSKVWMLLPTLKGNKDLGTNIYSRFSGTASSMEFNILENFTQGIDLRVKLQAHPYFIVIPKTGNYKFTYKITGSFSKYNNFLWLTTCSHYPWGDSYDTEYVIHHCRSAASLTPSINESPAQVQLEKGSRVYIILQTDNTYGSYTINTDVKIEFVPDEKDNEADIEVGYPIRENLPDMTAFDFVKSVMGLFGLMAEIKNNVFHFFTMDDVVLNKGQAIDITSFLVDKKSEELRYTYGLTQKNTLKYEEDSLTIKGYGDYSFSANTYNKNENVVVQNKFSAGIPALYKLEDEKYRLQKTTKSRVLYEDGEVELQVRTSPIDEIKDTKSVTFKHFSFEELKYENLVPAFWNGYISAFANSPRIRKVNVLLPPSFMQSFSFRVPVIIDSNFYGVTSIKNYGKSGIAEMELVLLDGIAAINPQALKNVILESFSNPIKFDFNNVALYSDVDKSIEVNGKLIRELDENVGIDDNTTVPIDLGYGEAKKVKLKKIIVDEVEKNQSDLSDKFIRKDIPDVANEHITFRKGIAVEGGALADVLEVSGLAKAGSLQVAEGTRTRDLVVSRLAEILQLSVTEVATLARAVVKEYISSETFIPGFDGEGMKVWKLASGDWNGELDSLTIRKSLTAFELIISKVRAVKGALALTQGNGKVRAVERSGDNYVIEVEDEMSFVAGDFVRCQTWKATGSKYYWVTVARVDGNSIVVPVSEFGGGTVPTMTEDFTAYVPSPEYATMVITRDSIRITAVSEYMAAILTKDVQPGESNMFSVTVSGMPVVEGSMLAFGNLGDSIAEPTILINGTHTISYNNTTSEVIQMAFVAIGLNGIPLDITVQQIAVSVPSVVPAVGDELVQMGNATDVNRQSMIYLSAAEDGRPVIDVLNGINGKSLAGKMKARFGCLDGITDSDFPADMQPSGYGLYCANGFFKGVFVLRSGVTVDGAIDALRDVAANAERAAADAVAKADTAKTDAQAANALLADIANDNKLTAQEKQAAKKEWDVIVSEKVKNDASADKYEVPRAEYGTAYSNLNSYITPLLASLSTTSNITGTEFRGKFKAYYDARTDLLNAIAAKAKTLAESAQSAAQNAQNVSDQAKAAADEAKGKADEANALATEAKNKLTMWANDGVISPPEKLALKQEQKALEDEKVQIVADAAKYSVSTTAYVTAYNSYNAELAYHSQAAPENVIVRSSFATNQAAYYTAKQAVLNAIAAAAKAYAEEVANTVRAELRTELSAIPGRITAAVTEAKTYTDDVKSELDSRITVNSNSIALKAEKTVVEGLSTRLSSAEQKITPEAIRLVVREQTQGVVDDLEGSIKSSFDMTTSGISLLGKTISMTGKVTFSALATDAQSKINGKATTSDIDSRINTFKNTLGSLAYKSMVEKAQLGTTVISGGYIRTELINAAAIITAQLIADAILTNGLNVNNNFTIDRNGFFKGVGGILTGAFRSPFKSGTFSWGDSVISIPGLQDNNNVIIANRYSGNLSCALPCNMNYDGFNATIINEDFNGVSTVGKLSFTAHGGNVYEDGVRGTTLQIAPHEGVDIQGFSDGSTFRGWIVKRRFRISGDSSSTKYYTVEITVSPAGAGTVTGGGRKAEGTVGTLTATPAQGYAFDRWSDDNRNVTREITWDYDKYWTAYFVASTTYYTITVQVSPSGSGSVSGGGRKVSGSTGTLTATANSGYRFVRWSDNNTSASRSVTWDSDRTYTAYFELADSAELLTNANLSDKTGIEDFNIDPDLVGTNNILPFLNQIVWTFTGYVSGSLRAFTFNKGYLSGKLVKGKRYRLSLRAAGPKDDTFIVLLGTTNVSSIDLNYYDAVNGEGGMCVYTMFNEVAGSDREDFSYAFTAERTSTANDAIIFITNAPGGTVYIRDISLKEI